MRGIRVVHTKRRYYQDPAASGNGNTRVSESLCTLRSVHAAFGLFLVVNFGKMVVISICGP